MAANNLRIVYDNQVDYVNSSITTSSTFSSTTTAANLKADARSLIWRSATGSSTSTAVIIKNTTSNTVSGVHSNLTIGTSGAPSLFYTLTPLGGVEAGTAITATTTTTVIPDAANITGYVFATYNAGAKTTLLDRETIPVLFSAAGVITPVLSNDFHRAPTSADGLTVTYTGSGTNIHAYDGSTPLVYSPTISGAGMYRVVSSGSSITVGTLSAGTGNGFAVCGAHSAMIANTATVTFSLEGKTWANANFTSTITQTIVKSLTLATDPIYSMVTTSTIARALVHLSLPQTTNVVEAVGLTYTNLSRGSTIRVLGYGAATISLAGTTDNPVISTTNTALINTNHIQCCPFTSVSQAGWSNLNYGTVSWGLDKQLARAWIPQASWAVCRNVVLDIIDPNTTDNYIEASKLICGDYWSPTYNTEYGLSVGLQDDSEVVRSEGGNLITSNGVVYKTLNFNLNHLTPTDRNEMVKLLRNSGRRRGIFISLFPDNVDDYEQESLYQLYGKLSSGFDLSHPYYQYFSTSIQLEEI